MLTLEWTGLHTGYTPSMQTIPNRVTPAKKPAPFKFIAYDEDGRYHNGQNSTLPPFGRGCDCGVYSRTSLSGCCGGVSPGRCTSANVTPHVGSKRRRVEYDDDAEDGAAYGDNDYGDCLDFLGRGKRH